MNIKLNPQQISAITDKLKKYFDDELHQDIGQFEAEFLLDFFAKEVGVYYYNKGIQDASTLMNEKLEDLQHGMFEIEQPEPY
ncbi:DUF2164 domain-containing protein [Pseudomonas sp. HK3]|jgi:uncharacterized protein (DUF2164 family)